MGREETSGRSKMRTSENKIGDYLANTLKYLDAVVFSSSPDGRQYYFITDAIERIAGLSAQEALENPFAVMRMIVPKDIAHFRTLTYAIREQRSKTAEYRILNKRKELVYIRHSVFPVVENGEVCRVDGIIFDISREKQNEINFRKSEEKLRSLIETANDLIFSLDKGGNFISVNSAGALNLEYLPAELQGRHFLEFIDEDDKQEVVKSFRDILKSREVVTFDAAFKSKYGKMVFLEVSARAMYEQSSIEGVLGIARDISRRRQDQEKMKELNSKLIEANRIISIERDRAKQKISILEELNIMKNEFVSNISHELRTPLASIIGFAETIDSDRAIPEDMRVEFNQIILTEAKRLSKLINDVLDISKIEDGKITFSKSDFNIGETLQTLTDIYRAKAEAKGIVFFAQLPKAPIPVFGDKNRIYQVFDNLLSNAIKFTDGGRITLLSQQLFREFEIIITDTGIGIPKQDIPHLFRKFYRVSRPGSEIPGTGLGLAFVKQIIDLHKGYITIQSEEKKGTTVLVRLPINKQEL